MKAEERKDKENDSSIESPVGPSLENALISVL
jgi:hypothetical protein